MNLILSQYFPNNITHHMSAKNKFAQPCPNLSNKQSQNMNELFNKFQYLFSAIKLLPII